MLCSCVWSRIPVIICTEVNKIICRCCVVCVWSWIPVILCTEVNKIICKCCDVCVWIPVTLQEGHSGMSRNIYFYFVDWVTSFTEVVFLVSTRSVYKVVLLSGLRNSLWECLWVCGDVLWYLWQNGFLLTGFLK